MSLQATVLDDISAEIGYVATCALIAWYAGKQLYVPSQADARHPLARVIGDAPLRALVRAWGGEVLKIPADAAVTRFRRDRHVCERFAEGWTPARVADEFGMGERRAQQLLEELVARGWLAYATGGALVRLVGPGAAGAA